jgi:cytochrome c-type biogenesis protein CcmH/NrfG
MTSASISSLLAMGILLIASMAILIRPWMRLASGRIKTIIGGVVVLAMVSSLGLYASYGSFGLPDRPLHLRVDELAQAKQQQANAEDENLAALQAARQAVADDPDNIEAQFRLADAAAVAGDSDTEINTLKAILRQTGNPLLKAMIGEALTRQSDGIVTTRALAWIEDGLAEAPNDWRGRYLKGLYLSQSGDDFSALAIWSPLAEDLNGSEIFPAVVNVITDAANRVGVNPDDYLPATTPSIAEPPTQADIANMVANLEEELFDASVQENRERWVMLVRSLINLGVSDRRDRAISHYLDQMPGESDDTPILLSFVELLLPLDDLPAEMPPILSPLLEKARALSPDNHGVLFFSGLHARSLGDRQSVEIYWRKLLSALDPENPLSALLENELNK